MKAGNCSRVWRPVAGVMLVSALTFAVTAQGGPRDTRDAGRPKSETARMVTGPSSQIQQAVAGGGTTFELRPVKDYTGGSYNSSIYTQANISGNTLTLTGAPGRVYIELHIDDWSSAIGVNGNNGFLRLWETYVDAMGYMSGTGTALTPAVEPCAGGAAGNAECAADFGAPITASNTGYCNAGLTCNFGFINKVRPDGIYTVVPCSTNIWDVGNLLDPLGHNYFGVLDQEEAGTHCGLPDSVPSYSGSFALDAPAGIAGTYTIGLQVDKTFSQDDTPENANDIPIAAFIDAVINVPTGSCCFGIGTPGAGCIDDQTQSQCSARPAVNQFAVGDTCDAPPTDAGCCACLTNADCNDGDACTNDSCNNCICSNVNVPSWDAAGGECCDAGSGAQCTPAATNTCETAACQSQDARGGRGPCVTTPIADGLDCTGDGDGNPCSFRDICTGGVCQGTPVNPALIPCATDADCQAATGLSAPVCVAGICNCSLVPDLTVDITDSGKADPNCFDSGDAGAKVIARVHAAAATTPINGGQFLITYDPSCLDYNSAVGVAPYVDQVFGPIVNEAAGTIFTVVGVGFGVGDGPAGNADMVELSFTKIGDCNSCQICFASNNPQNTYLADNTGQRVFVNPICSKAIVANNVLTLDTPDNSKHNVDCDSVVANVSWATPTVSDSCGNSTLTCSGEHQSGLAYGQDVAMNGGSLGVGISNFCCTAASDWCDKTAEGCWTVEVNDETSLDVKVALSPSAQSKPGDDLTRCIKFTMYPNTVQASVSFETDVTFGGVNEFVGKAKDVVKIPGHGRWDCITAWDQLHTLRSCYLIDSDEDCVDGVLHATFEGDPGFGGNWLISGNLDGYKKSLDTAGNASLFVIDIVDYVALVATWGTDYGTGDTPCGTAGPHGDIDGDGLVGLTDYGFISMNFLASAKECCGYCAVRGPDGHCKEGLPAGVSVEGVTEMTVTQLRLQGYADAARADLNGDGLVNLEDMNLFGQGVRPESKNVRGIRKDAGTR